MSLRKDVYELLCLYRGPHRREAFKPRLQPEDWREREKDQLLFRTQVPDHLEPAYDIALAEGLIEEHLLTHGLQLKWYEMYLQTHPDERGGQYDIQQPERAKDDPAWRVVPPFAEALVEVTEKGLAAIAEHITPPTEAAPDVPLSKTEEKVMLYLLDHDGCLRQQPDIMAGTDLSKGTVSSSLTTLRNKKLVHRPEGKRKGEGLTEAGREIARRAANHAGPANG